MGKVFKTYLSGPRIFCCHFCKTHLACQEQIVSKAFQGRHGAAFLFNNCVNVTVGPSEERNLITGLHTVADISCVDCGDVLGWKYEEAYDDTQKYKVGKFILERAKIGKDSAWE